MNNLTDNNIYILRLNYEEKLVRYMKLYNECTERTIEKRNLKYTIQLNYRAWFINNN